MNVDVVIIGGGAAGFFTGANIELDTSLSDILLIEAGNKPLAKVRVSGGGRCNVTHHEFDIERLSQFYPRGNRELRSVFSRFQPRDMIEWLNQRGVRTKTEEDGRMFPVSDDSGTIIRCLQKEANDRGVRLLTGKRVQFIERIEDRFCIRISKGEDPVFSRFVVLATGSHPGGYRLAASFGHKIVPPVSSLFTFNINDVRLNGLAGLSFPHVMLRLSIGGKVFVQHGPMLITHWGLSGPAILKCSAWAARELNENQYRGEITINFAPDETHESISKQLHELLGKNAQKNLAKLPVSWFPKRYWQQLIGSFCDSNLKCSQTSKKIIQRITREIIGATFKFTGKSTNKDEFVTAGGVDLLEVDFKTMQSKLQPHLFFAGEILNIDGLTGGFNFQNAWSTAHICAKTIEARLREIIDQREKRSD